ncbi:MAG: hypothetical protein D6736_00315 [Nitrospinota bacterium]|nr:MAG: hypothetical protein D6736_00315 [Nitrospinota bacterium]
MAIQWDATWTHGRRGTVEGALERITRMLLRSYLSIRVVRSDQQAKATYVQHFRDPLLNHLPRASNIIRLMHDRVTTQQVMIMSYVPNLAAFNALGLVLPPGMSFETIEAFVIQRGVAAAMPLTVYIGPAFFTHNVYIPKAVNQRTGTGTILHELSHGVGNTADHAYTWEPRYASLTANQRTNNADSYRAYCQSFDML